MVKTLIVIGIISATTSAPCLAQWADYYYMHDNSATQDHSSDSSYYGDLDHTPPGPEVPVMPATPTKAEVSAKKEILPIMSCSNDYKEHRAEKQKTLIWTSGGLLTAATGTLVGAEFFPPSFPILVPVAGIIGATGWGVLGVANLKSYETKALELLTGKSKPFEKIFWAAQKENSSVSKEDVLALIREGMLNRDFCQDGKPMTWRQIRSKVVEKVRMTGQNEAAISSSPKVSRHSVTKSIKNFFSVTAPAMLSLGVF